MYDRPEQQHRFNWGLLWIVGLGSLARFWQAGESLWLDELHTSWVVSAGLAEIPARAQIGNQSPLYFFLVRGVVSLLGEHELTIRLPSLAAGIGLNYYSGVVTRRWSGSSAAGWLAAALVAVDHNMIFFSQEARPYALVQLVALWQFAAFWRLQTTPGRTDRLVVSGGWIVMFYLHYTAILLVAGEVIWWAAIQVWQRGRGSYRPSHLLTDLGITAIACGIALPHLAEIAARRSMWEMFVLQKPAWAAWRWFHWNLYVIGTCTVCGGGLLMKRVWRWLHGSPASDPSPPPAGMADAISIAPLLVCWWASPASIAWMLTAGDVARIYFPRYLVGAAVAPMICGGLCLLICRSAPLRGIALTTVLGLAIWSNGLWTQYQRDGRLISDRRQDWRAAVAWLNNHRHDNSPVLVRSGLIEADRLRNEPESALRGYCLLPVTSLYRIVPPENLLPLPTTESGRLSAPVAALVRQQRHAWLVLSARPAAHETIRNNLRDSLPGMQVEMVRDASFGHVAVWQVRLGDDG